MKKSELRRQLENERAHSAALQESLGIYHRKLTEAEQQLSATLCARCERVLPLQTGFTAAEAAKYQQFDNNAEVKISFSGGYGQFIDSYDGPVDFSLNLCHECGHELAEFLDIDVSYWHTHNPASGQHPDHHKGNF